MAFLTGGEEQEVLSDINITPLVDVMLVLLIIFMITAPMLHQGIEVALPKSEAPAIPNRASDPVVLSINRDGLIYLKDRPVHPTKLIEVLTPLLRGRSDETVFLKGDRDVPYGRVIEVLDTLHRGGIVKVGMVTERPDQPRR
ncbi:MAG: protein TolR [Thermoanaerobaculia bacterium]|jgi:biopolymer transport protein TolR|nr:MAG: protein TolR [Thermoanaerobaculia bacterium]MBZ0101527.1 protein TolR [Thermoanaerobaculia bacterium]